MIFIFIILFSSCFYWWEVVLYFCLINSHLTIFFFCRHLWSFFVLFTVFLFHFHFYIYFFILPYLVRLSSFRAQFAVSGPLIRSFHLMFAPVVIIFLELRKHFIYFGKHLKIIIERKYKNEFKKNKKINHLWNKMNTSTTGEKEGGRFLKSLRQWKSAVGGMKRVGWREGCSSFAISHDTWANK